jgi:D-hydroxyproline dehydrogenase subunit alpha
MRALRCDVLVAGAGPAGIAAACAASESGRRVIVVDDNPFAGGQIWRGGPGTALPREAQQWLARFAACGSELEAGVRIIDAPKKGMLLAEGASGPATIGYDRLVLATGARELFLPFPGWTLPGVTGAGGLQALVKHGWPIKGQRVVVAGSGPLLFAVAAAMKKKGAHVLLVAEQASRASVAGFATYLARKPGKLAQAVGYAAGLAGIRKNFGCWVARAEGTHRLRKVFVTDGRVTREIPCDYLACGFGLVPNLELASLLGCEIAQGAVRVSDQLETSVPGVFACGEALGVAGLDAALVEGQMAGWAAAGVGGRGSGLRRKRTAERAFALHLAAAFRLRDELKNLPDDETVVCRCEDVRWSSLKAYTDRRAAKLQTRCGMGPCQGRVCGAATDFLLGWNPAAARPPLFPSALGSLAGNPPPTPPVEGSRSLS